MQSHQHLYYEDPFTTRFLANVMEVVHDKRGHAVILNRTFFYPTSGGQPHDIGTLNGIPVVDVTLREADGAVWHWLATGIDTDKVTAVIDWPRRFDHMQQHSGQHILSQAFIQVADAATNSFHLSKDSVTIDLDIGELVPQQLRAAEQLANEIIWENRAIKILFVSAEDAQEMNLRKIPEMGKDLLRIVEIDKFDRTACGGTHVADTGAVGLIKILKQERIRGQVRIEFCCGLRALDAFRHDHGVVTDLMGELTTASSELLPAVIRMQEEIKETGRQLKHTTSELMMVEADRLHAQSGDLGDLKLVTHVFSNRDPGQLRIISRHLTQTGRLVALLGLAGEKSFLLFARSEDSASDMRALLQPALAELQGRGGGTAETAQGGGPPASPAQVRQAIDLAVQTLHNEVK